MALFSASLLLGLWDGFYLKEAVGTASEIYVVFPQNGKLYLGRGAVFDYYEFKSDSRLTDENSFHNVVDIVK